MPAAALQPCCRPHLELTLWPPSNLQVRTQAYTGLAAYPMPLLEALGFLRPLSSYAELLLKEQDPDTLACEALVVKALEHEHVNRRRYGHCMLGSRLTTC